MKRRAAGLLLAVMMVGSAMTVPAGAREVDLSAPAAGAAAFQCQVTLPWPTPSGTNAVCSGDAFGAGVHGTTPFVAAGGGNFTAEVKRYSEACFLGEPPLVGSAEGDALIRTTTGVPVEASFTWTRVGLTAVVVTGPPTVNGEAHGGGGGAAVAGFAPLPTGGIPTCEAPGQLTALVAGAVALAGL